MIVGIFILLMIVFLYLVIFERDGFENENTDNIIIENNTIQLSSLTLKQKLAQMIMVRGDGNENIELTNVSIGGIFLDRQESDEAYSQLISKYQKESKIKLLVATDLEGSWTPFPYNPDRFPYFSDIKTGEEAYNAGLSHGKLLKELGFNMNFAPVAEFTDLAYGGRTFSGSKEEVKSKLTNYINGLQENVAGTCKHYPGKTLQTNLHVKTDTQTIDKDDLELFELCAKQKISAIMVSHPVVEGELDSQGKPSSVSEEVIGSIPNDILVIADEINMRGLKNFYIFNKRKMYQDLINSGENFILDFKLDNKGTCKLIADLEEDVKKGKINEEKIDESVRKILKLKGYDVR